MRIKLLRNWFGPDGTLIQANQGPAEVPDSWEHVLPSSAMKLPDLPVAEEVSAAKTKK